MSEQPKLSAEAQKALQDQTILQKVTELEQISRLAVNTLNLICSNDIKIPSSYAKPVAEIQDWLTGMHKAVQDNIQTVKALLSPEALKKASSNAPVQEEAKSPVVDAQSPTAVPLEVVADVPKA